MALALALRGSIVHLGAELVVVPGLYDSLASAGLTAAPFTASDNLELAVAVDIADRGHRADTADGIQRANLVSIAKVKNFEPVRPLVSGEK